MTTDSSSQKKPKVVFSTVSGPGAGAGHASRALAIRNALDRKGLLDKLDFWLAGAVDRPDLWPDKDKLKTLPEGTPLNPANVCDLLATLQADLILLDGYFDWYLQLLAKITTIIDTVWQKPKKKWIDAETRPATVWGLARFYPGAYGNLPNGMLDRLYQHENFVPPMSIANWGLASERCRSQAEKKGIAWRPYQPVKDNGSYFDLHYKPCRKLISPIVNVDLEQILPPDVARTELLHEAGIENDPGKKIILITGSQRKLEDGYDKFHDWIKENLRRAGDGNIAVVAGVGGKPIKDIYRYLPGCDYVLATAGYNTFYEVRYLKHLGLFKGQALFYALTTRVQDQEWRVNNQEMLMRTGPKMLPEGELNGADYIATAIGRKLGLLV